MDNQNLPIELQSTLNGETPEFVAYSRRANPPKKGISLLLFAFAWLSFDLLFVFFMALPLLKDGELNITINDVPQTVTLENLDPLLMPSIFLGLFIVLGIGMLVAGLYSLFKKGGYFVGTPSRLVTYMKGEIRSIDWEQFSGDIQMKNKGEKGTLTLGLRTGEIVNSKNGGSRFVPEAIYMVDIDNVFAVEQNCRKCIKSNDPTPSA